jgi:carbon storage regulator
MLVLCRKIGEKIVLPDQEVEMTILEVKGNKVRIGISAPRGVPVYRQEVWKRIEHEQSWTPSLANGPGPYGAPPLTVPAVTG